MGSSASLEQHNQHGSVSAFLDSMHSLTSVILPHRLEESAVVACFETRPIQWGRTTAMEGIIEHYAFSLLMSTKDDFVSYLQPL